MRKICIIIALLSTTYTSFSQKVAPISNIKQLIDSIQKIIVNEHIPGTMVGITTKDSVLFSGGFGYADVENKRLVDSKTLFRMGSNTKMFVSLAILKLQSEGKINLNNEIKKIAPEIKFTNAWEATNPMKVINLLEHTSGFDDIKLNAMYSLEKFEKSDLLTCNQASLVCRWRPSERFSYSNPNYNLLGYLIEKITQKPYNQYLTQEILIPLGMNSSNFNLYSKTPKDTKEYLVIDGKYEQKIPSVTLIGGPQGALWSCSDDMLKLLQMYLRNGQPIFSEKIITQMETPQSSLGAKAGLKSGYALGNSDTHFHNKFQFRGHYGLTGTCFSTCIYNRELGVAYVIASNGNTDNSKIEELIANYLEQNLMAKKIATQPLDKKTIEPFLGFYQFGSPRNEIGEIRDNLLIANKLSIENDTLLLKPLMGGESVKLIQTAPLTFMRKGTNAPTIVFTKNSEGKNVEMMGGTYFEQGSYFLGIVKRLAIVFMVVLILISGIVATVSLIRAFLGNILWEKLPMQFLPIFSTGILWISVSKLIEVQSVSYLLYQFNDINAHTLTVFLGTLFFGIAALLCFWRVLRSFSQNKNYTLTWFWQLTYASIFIIGIILFNVGWIGLRTWAM